MNTSILKIKPLFFCIFDKIRDFMSAKTKIFIYQFISFAIVFIPLRYLITWLAQSDGIWIPFLAFVLTLFIAPKFQLVQTKEGSKIWMKWFFSKNRKEL